MRNPQNVVSRIKYALRFDRAVRLVWQASRAWTVFAIILAAIQGVLPLAALYLVKLIVDAITGAIQTGAMPGDFTHIAALIGATAGVAVLQAGIGKAGEYVSEAQAAIVTDYVSATLHQKSVDLDLAYYENPHYYDTLHRAQQEGPYRPTRIVNGLTRLLQSGVSLVAMVGLLFLFHWSAALVLFASTVPGLIVHVIYAQKRYEWQKKRTPAERRAAYLNSVLTFDLFAKDIRLFDLGQYFRTSFQEMRNSIRDEHLALSRSRAMADCAAQIFGALVLMGCFWFIAYRALIGAISVGDLVMYFQAFQRGINHLKELLSSAARIYEDNMFVSHFFALLDIKNEIADPPHPKQLPQSWTRGIALEQVGFGYPGEREPVLKEVSLSIAPGEVVALVGANGAGKSTIVKLLCRLYDPQKGCLTMEGFDFRDLSQKDLRRQISVVFQDYVRYFLTVKENIWLGDTTAPPDIERIREAARKADADSFIRRLPAGYDSLLGRWFDSGEELSLGEWQKIVLAKAFIRDCRLVILDEPTSFLDAESEHHLYLKFKELMAGRSALVISHRFSTVSMADRIYVLDNGYISEQGSHKELMAQNGKYADMFRKQTVWLDALQRGY